MAEQLTGKCVGGPYDGQMLAHTSRTKKFYRPMVDAFAMSELAEIEAVEIGEYKLNNFGQWHWWATAAGRAAGRNGELQRRYGITLADYNKLFDSQGRCCAICKGSALKPADWHVYHCHATNVVRGILCRHCNRALGAVKDSTMILQNAILYLLCR